MSGDFVPGELRAGEGTIRLNEGRETATVTVANAGDRPVQVGSHAHFFEVNRALAFDRAAAFGMRLDIPAGTAVRFEPGEEATVDLVALGGKRRVRGQNGLTEGSVDEPDGRAGGATGSAGGAADPLARAREEGFLEEE